MLDLLAISSTANLARLEQIKSSISKLRDPRGTTPEEAARIARETPPIGWINFGTDGNETSAFECSMQLAYQLAAGTDPLTRKILDNVVVIINPCLSPDSHQWFTTWAKAVTTRRKGNPDPQAAEHGEDWFVSTDGNHYLIDVNRDAFALMLRGFENGGREFGPGTFLVRVGRNPGSLHARIAELAAEIGTEVVAVNSGWAEKGISFGSAYVHNLKKPKIAVLTHEPTRATAYGSVYALLEQRFDLEFTALRGDAFGTADLSRYNVIIFPDGSPAQYQQTLGEAGVSKLRRWIEDGGTFIGLQGGAAFTARKGVELTDVRLLSLVLAALRPRHQRFQPNMHSPPAFALPSPDDILLDISGGLYG